VFIIDSVDLDRSKISICGHEIDLAFASRYNVYNLCAAFALCSLVGIPKENIARSLSSFVMKNGRVVRFRAGENEGTLITSKHENSTSYNRSLEFVSAENEPFRLAIIVDAISRKYYTTETSWLWDVSFEMLKDSKAKRILLCGNYAYDLALRFELCGIDGEKLEILPDLDLMADRLRDKDAGKLFAITCFSDKGKLFDRVELI
jgi:hypothetical protein